jgi:hypothetical protein
MTALRRFGFAAERSRPEDRIIDLMIAAEALFLRGGEQRRALTSTPCGERRFG